MVRSVVFSTRKSQEERCVMARAIDSFDFFTGEFLPTQKEGEVVDRVLIPNFRKKIKKNKSNQ